MAILLLGENDLASGLARRARDEQALVEEEERAGEKEPGRENSQEEIADHLVINKTLLLSVVSQRGPEQY